MNVLNKLTKKNLLLNKKRTVVTIIGIMLSTALVCAVAGLVTSAQQTFVNLIKNSDGDYHVFECATGTAKVYYAEQCG